MSMGSAKDGKDVLELEEKLSKILSSVVAISKENVNSRNRMAELMDMQTILMENQTAMMSGLQAMLGEIKELHSDLKQLQHALLYVFETAVGGKVKDVRKTSMVMEQLVKGGVNALAEHRGQEALGFIQKMHSTGGGK